MWQLKEAELISPYSKIKCFDQLYQSNTPCLHLLNTDKGKKMADINIDGNQFQVLPNNILKSKR